MFDNVAPVHSCSRQHSRKANRPSNPPSPSTCTSYATHLHAGDAVQSLDLLGRVRLFPVPVSKSAEAPPAPREDLSAVGQHRRVLPPTAHLRRQRTVIRDSAPHAHGRMTYKSKTVVQCARKQSHGGLLLIYSSPRLILCLRLDGHCLFQFLYIWGQNTPAGGVQYTSFFSPKKIAKKNIDMRIPMCLLCTIYDTTRYP